MPSRHKRPDVCKHCGQRGKKRNPISFRGLCQACAVQRVTDAATGMVTKRGPAYEAWVAGVTRYAEDVHTGRVVHPLPDARDDLGGDAA